MSKTVEHVDRFHDLIKLCDTLTVVGFKVHVSFDGDLMTLRIRKRK